MDISTFNALEHDDAIISITQCCAAYRWVEALVSGRPYSNWQTLLDAADTLWLNMIEEDLLEAFSAHPQIGNVDTLRAKYANTKTLASGEQGLVKAASESTLEELAKLNQNYIEKFGFIFIVCATGKSADQMLEMLRERVQNTREQELDNAAFEQHKITVIRLKKLFNIADKA